MAERPSFVLLFADDMGYSDIGCYGSETATPNLDRLAAEGLRFSRFYTTPRCCPSRASLLTGLYPHQAGIGHMMGDWGKAGYRGFLNDRCATIAKALRLAGYRTLMSGKWHVGEHRPHWPCDRGFDHYAGLISGASNYWKLSERRTMAINNEPFVPDEDGFYMTDFITDRAVEFIGRHGRDEKPFFLYVSYTAPHWPLHAWPEDIEKYRGGYLRGWDVLRSERLERQVAMGLIRHDWPLTPRDENAPAWDDVPAREREALDLKMAVYAAQIDRMDQGVGRILAKLAEVGTEHNTVVMFLSDNGGCAEEIESGDPEAEIGTKDSYVSYGLPWANASNTPFRLYKHWVHEGGIATPFVVRWPAGLADPGRTTHGVAHIMDIMPTCLELAGAEHPRELDGRPVLPLEGMSFAPLLKNASNWERNVVFWEHEGNKAVCLGRWKLACKFPGQWELYDMEAGRTECGNLIERHPDKADELAALYEPWARRSTVEPWPVKRD